MKLKLPNFTNPLKRKTFIALLFMGFALPNISEAKKNTEGQGTDLNSINKFRVSSPISENSDPHEKHVIAYNSPFSYPLGNSTRWEITNIDTGSTYKSGMGAINDIIFDTPGNYQINVSGHSGDDFCGDGHLSENILLQVSPLKMEFDFSTVKISNGISGGRSSVGTTLTVNALFSSYDGQPATYKNPFHTAGVRTSIVGNLKNGEATLQQGVNTLEFRLEGQASRNTYISIDFIDINGQIQSYRLTNKIK